MNSKVERAEYRAREILIRIKGVNNWIKENPHITDANMYEIMYYLIETGWIISDLNNQYDIPSNAKEVINEMKTMLSSRKEYIDDFTNSFGIKAIWENYLNKVFSGNLVFNSTEEDNKTKDLLCKEMAVANYIYGVKRNEPDYKYDNKLEFEEMININDSLKNKDIMSQVLLKVIGENFDKESTKGHIKKSIKNECYDQITFSSVEEEKEFINNSTNQFSIKDFFLNHKDRNALIILDYNNEYCIEPVDIHMVAAMKLYRAIHNESTNKSIEEALNFNNDQGNIVIRLINRGGLQAFVPFFPSEMNEFQINKMNDYLESFEETYESISDKDKEIFKEGIEEIKNNLNNYSKNNKHTKS